MTVLRLDAHTRDQRWELSVAGELDIETAVALTDAIDALPPGATAVLDLDGLTFMDSSGLRALLKAHLAGRDLVLANPRPAVLKVLGIAEVLDLFTIEMPTA